MTDYILSATEVVLHILCPMHLQVVFMLRDILSAKKNSLQIKSRTGMEK